MARKLVYGVGINDADYIVCPKINGKQAMCPFYKRWTGMLMRCYDPKFHKNHPTYAGCKVCDEWLLFSNFRSWMERQDWEGNQLDKDIIHQGNKVYSPDNCAFVSARVNYFMTDCSASRGDHPIGAVYVPKYDKFKATCKNGIKGKCDFLGYFDLPQDAHLAWKAKKHEIACRLASEQSDHRVAEALRGRYL